MYKNTEKYVPPEIAAMKWNWGACLAPGLWHLFNGLGWWALGYIVISNISVWLLVLIFSVLSNIPVIGLYYSLTLLILAIIGPIIPVVFVFPRYSNIWAWKYRNFQSIEQFRQVQSYWLVGGIIGNLPTIIVLILSIILSIYQNN